MQFLLLQFLVLPAIAYCSITPSCPSGTIASPHDNQWCYKFVNQSASFDDAEYFCENAGGFLAEVNDQFTNNFLYHNAKTNFMSGAFWIGAKLYKSGSCSIWVWIRENSIISFFDWSQPDAGTSGSGDRISVNTDEGTWTPQNKSAKLPYVCQIPKSYSISECGSGWTHFDLTDKCYKVFVQNSVTFDVAENNCGFENAHLASIHSQDENDFIGQLTSNLLLADELVEGVWIGFASDANYQWTWSDKSQVDYLNWGEHDPDHTPSFCALFIPDGFAVTGYEDYVKKWDAYPCYGQPKRYICKKDPVVTLINSN